MLLTAAIDNTVVHETDPVPPEMTPWWQDGTTTADGRRAIELFVSSVAVIEQRAAELDRAAIEAATTDPEVEEVRAHHEQLRVAGFRSYVDTFVSRGLLRVGLDAAEATDGLPTLAGLTVFLDFTEGRGWSLERYVAGTTEALCSLRLENS